MKKILSALLLTLTVVTPFFNVSCSNEVSTEKIEEYTKAYVKLNKEQALINGDRIEYCEFKDLLYSKDGLDLVVFFDATSKLHTQPSTCIGEVCLDVDSLYKPVVYENGKMEMLKDVIDFTTPSESKYGEETSLKLIKLFNKYIENRELTEKEKYYYLSEERLQNELTEDLSIRLKLEFNNILLNVSWLVLPEVNQYQTYFVTEGDYNTGYGDFVYKEYAGKKILTQEKTDFYLIKNDEIILLEDAYKDNKVSQEDVVKVLDAYNKNQGYLQYWDSLIHFVK